MNIYFKLLLCFLYFTFVNADPCNDAFFGRCDKKNGLCWGTSATTSFCTCKAGYEPGQNTWLGHRCHDVDECKENICDEETSFCVNTAGSYECVCKCGYVKDYTGQYCLDASQINGLCMIPNGCEYRFQVPWLRLFPDAPFNTLYRDSYKPKKEMIQIHAKPYRRCKCEKGFTFDKCGYCVDHNECARKNPCKGPRSFCVNTEGSFYCGCEPPYVLGPCKERCYRRREAPELCEKPKLDVLFSSGFSFKLYNNPIILENYDTCAPGVETGQTTVNSYDTDHDKKPDIRITWSCSETDGSSVLQNYAEDEAFWREWTCWTACKATPWGGVQTRSRKCAHGLPGRTGCLGEGSQKMECYTGKKQPYRIRKDAAKLSEKEKQDLFQAMKKYKADQSAKGFFNAAASHGWPFQCNRESCCPHGAKMKFISWHRSIVLYYEEGLSRYLKDKTLGIPYWNWLATKQDPPALVWNQELYGQDNPFANMTVRIDQTGPMRTIQRNKDVFLPPVVFAKDTWFDIAVKKQKPHMMHDWASSTESAHGGPHVSACGTFRFERRCTISLASLDYAGFDPIFMFHHSQVDRLWEVAIQNMADDGNTTWTTQTALENFEERADFGRRFEPFNNLTLNPFPIVRATNNMRDSYYMTELTGVKYDYVGRNGLPKFEARSLRKPGNEILFIGQYFQSTFKNVYVNYYLVGENDDQACDTFTETLRYGSVIRLGNSRRYSQTIPTLTPIEKFGQNTGLSASFYVKACYTEQVNCKERCPEMRTARLSTQPGPMLVHYLPNQPVDIYKFWWAQGKRVPSWYINLHANSQWVYFYGNRSQYITQVRSAGAYVTCNAKGGRKLRCTEAEGGKACILPSGIYYLIDSSYKECRNGLRMMIVTRK